MQTTGNFQRGRSLIRKGAGASNILLRNSGAVETIENPEHSGHSPARPEQRHGKELVNLVFRYNVKVHTRSSAGLVGPENFLRP